MQSAIPVHIFVAMYYAMELMPPLYGQSIAANSVVALRDVGSVIVMPVRCDSSGDLFLQPPLSKINESGIRTAVYDLSAASADGFSDLLFKAFAIDPDGSLYQLAQARDQRVIVVKFAKDGHYSGSIVLDKKFEPQQLAVFKGESFIVSGIVGKSLGTSPEFSFYAALFDRSGRMIKEIDVSDPEQMKNGSNEAAVGRLPAPAEFGIAESDGNNVYLLRQGSSPIVFVLSPAGTVQRQLRLSPPFSGAKVTSFRVGAAQLLVEYVRPNAFPNGNAAYYLLQYDATTGQKSLQYLRDPGLRGILGCTDWKGDFSFLSSDDDGRAVLVKASAR